jgi:hypothetical protein
MAFVDVKVIFLQEMVSVEKINIAKRLFCKVINKKLKTSFLKKKLQL